MKILCVCGSPRDGNSESLIRKSVEILKSKGNEVEIILVREKNIPRCVGCVEYCNREYACKLSGDMQSIIKQMKNSDAFVFIVPSYFAMPPGIFKDFIDQTCVIFTEQEDTSKIFMDKKAVLIGVGAGNLGHNYLLMDNLRHFVKLLRMQYRGDLYLEGKSEIPEKDHILKQDGVIVKITELLNRL